MTMTDTTTIDSEPYTPAWARPDNPTALMSESAMRAYYKRTDVEASLRFYLSLRSIPLDLRAVYAALLDDIEGRKPTPTDKALIWQVRIAVANAREGRPYSVPAFAPTVKPTRKRTAKPCPHCGKSVAA